MLVNNTDRSQKGDDMTEPETGGLRHTPCGDLSKARMTNAGMAASLALTAARILQRIDDGDIPSVEIDRAAWRLSDALHLVEQELSDPTGHTRHV